MGLCVLNLRWLSVPFQLRESTTILCSVLTDLSTPVWSTAGSKLDGLVLSFSLVSDPTFRVNSSLSDPTFRDNSGSSPPDEISALWGKYSFDSSPLLLI